MSDNKPENAEQHLEKLVAEATSKANDPSVDLQATEGESTKPLGTKPDSTPKQAQRDYLPGSRRFDITEIPKYVYDEKRGENRLCGMHSDYVYHWVLGDPREGKVYRFKATGYRYVIYTGGVGLADGGFDGTGLFEPDSQNHTWLGDCVLMYAPRRLWNELQEAERERITKMQRAATENFMNDLYNAGVRGEIHQENPDDPFNPKVIRN